MARTLNATQKAQMRALFEENGLTPDDIFSHRNYHIITRQGIEKIQAKQKIVVRFELVDFDLKAGQIVMRARAWKEGDEERWVETFAEVSQDNSTNKYPWAMCEKRGLSRAVLKVAGLYMYGVFGEDEAEDFKKSKQ
jgi:hypothetical protein